MNRCCSNNNGFVFKGCCDGFKVGQIEAAVTAMNLSMQGQFDSLKVYGHMLLGVLPMRYGSVFENFNFFN